MIRLYLLQIIGMCPASPHWLKMWCIRQMIVLFHQQIEKLPPAVRARFDQAYVQVGKFKG